MSGGRSGSPLVDALYRLDAAARSLAPRFLLAPVKALVRALAERRLRRRLAGDLVVRAGPFRGMRYPALASRGSAVFPKLLGTYERELHGVIEELCGRERRIVVDVGAAEGYYAVGLALRLPGAEVHAFDTDPKAQAWCRRMAEGNGVASRVHAQGACAPSDLVALGRRGDGLLLCDCEGCEAELFTPDVAEALARWDLVIELHDWACPDLERKLSGAFSATHDAETIPSVSDADKVRLYRGPLLDTLAPLERRYALAERRTVPMTWLVLRARR